MEEIRKYDITAIGEALIDVIVGEEGGTLMMQGNPGGAPANVLAMAASNGLSTSLIAKVGGDEFGSYLKARFGEAGIGCGSLITDSDHPTTLAMVKLDETGNRHFSFYRDRTADVMLSEDELPAEAVENTRIMHFGSVSMTAEPSASATLSAVKRARAAGAVISFDPNLRKNLWKNLDAARDSILDAMALADLVKVSDEELSFLTGETDIDLGLEKLYNMFGMTALVLTLGGDGSLLKTGRSVLRHRAYDTGCVDTTGAGDAFWGEFLSQLIKRELLPDIGGSEDELEACLAYASAAGSLTTSRYGAISAIPSEDEIAECVRSGRIIE